MFHCSECQCDMRMLMFPQTVSTVEELRLPVYLPVVAVMFDHDKVSTLPTFLVRVLVFLVTFCNLSNTCGSLDESAYCGCLELHGSLRWKFTNIPGNILRQNDITALISLLCDKQICI